MSNGFETSYILLLRISNNLRKLADAIEKSINLIDLPLEEKNEKNNLSAEDYE